MSDNKDKAHEATPRRTQKAREEGNVAKSSELSSVVQFLAAIGLLMILAKPVMKSGAELILFYFSMIKNDGSVTQLLSLTIIIALLPISFTLVVAMSGIVATLIQIGPLFTTKNLKFDLDRLNPSSALKQLFQKEKLVSLGTSTAKTMIAAYLGWSIIYEICQSVELLIHAEPFGVWSWFGERILSIAFQVGLAGLFLAFIDFWLQKKKWTESLRMDDTELKQERKDTDKSPEVRAMLAEARHELNRPKSMGLLGSAKLVVANPTHIAIPLIEFEGFWFVGGKEIDEAALFLIEAAEFHKIPIMRNVSVARNLFMHSEVLKPLPPELSETLETITQWLESQRF